VTQTLIEKDANGAAMEEAEDRGRVIVRGKSHMPTDSVLFERVIPVLLAGFGIVTVILILFAAGVLLGIVPFR
jgi:hypothetical protein